MIFAGPPNAPLLGVNIDHVATLRNARGGQFPDPVAAAQLAVEAGADIITFHLREDRRHIRDDDVTRLKAALQVPLNFEAAVTDEMIGIIERVRPEHVCLVPERRQEVTTEGGLDVAGQFARIQDACARLAAAGCRVSLFINADERQIEASAAAGASCVELHTGAYAEAWWAQDRVRMAAELQRLQDGLRRGRAAGLQTNAGHGLAVWDRPAPHPFASSTYAVAALHEVTELHIGHALIGHAVFVGLRQAIGDFKAEAVLARNQGA
ncbi:pyridoxine 5'-phosphate synthase [Caldimonas brevitalea]|uniref:Pyridoxine 5'-phosphate synthase n=1 Tax=Caldimonas brevitalea TaxID=413882 RepID=A0A0G3BT17_9BURK|nr:pyridoxine 5'-phosphate synthase [Caldimonas brevitalea]AKJ31153.1 pyridoxine 5'-phosphate synthase [Caldimonas brevitalea]